jgi:transposase
MRVPGLRRINAYSLLAEIGADLKQFPTAAHLASWAAICPGNRESTGKQTSGRTRPGNRWLHRTLCEAAWARRAHQEILLRCVISVLGARARQKPSADRRRV